jgi:hypothetical protein
MKMHFSKMSAWQLILSVITLAFFIMLAVGSAEVIVGLNVPKTEVDTLSDGRIQETFYTMSQKRITTGRQDAGNHWTGKVTVKWTGGRYGYTEECTMMGGKRFFLSTRTYNYSDANGPHKEESWYINDECMPNLKAAHGISTDVSAYKVLGDTHPWYLSSLVACGFDSAYVEAYLDTLDILLNSSEFEVTEFNNYYDDVISALQETPYDSIITLNTDLFLYQGLQEIKNSELRLAVIDHYNSEGSSTFDIISSTYPGYLHTMNDSGIVNQDFEKFCQDLDDSLAGYGPLDREDPFYIDSIDSHLFRALYSILAVELPSSSFLGTSMKRAALVTKNVDVRNLYRVINSNVKQLRFKSTTSEVATMAVTIMLMQFIEGDIMRNAVREAYFTRKGIIAIPTVATVFAVNLSATSVALQGYVIKDGGAAITSRGIAWAAFYNPTTSDNSVTSETGSSDFSVTLSGLTEGTRYYARTYATNSKGTAYGNCINFVATSPTAIVDNEIFTRVFTIYPNPASAVTTFSFLLESPESLVLNIVDIKGQRVLYHDPGRLPQGVNHIDLDLSGLKDGMYNCQLTNGTSKITRKLVIAH